MANRVVTKVTGIRELKAAFAAISETVAGVAMVKQIERILLDRTKRRFVTKTTPRGTPWRRWASGTEERRSRKVASTSRGPTPFAIAHSGILVLTGSLYHSIKVYYGANTRLRTRGFVGQSGMGFTVGTRHPEAGRHQFGDSERNIPARPFLGITRGDANAIERMMRGVTNRGVRSARR